MEFNAYNISLYVLAGTMAFLGCHLTLSTQPESLKRSIYSSARNLMGTVFLATALCISIATSLIGYDTKYYQIALAITILAIMTIGTWRFSRKYRAATSQGGLFDVKGVGIDIRGIKRSVYSAIYVGAEGAAITIHGGTLPLWSIALFGIIYIGIAIYILRNTRHFLVLYNKSLEMEKERIKSVFSDFKEQKTEEPQKPESAEPKLSKENLKTIAREVKKWVAHKEYCQKEVSIMTAATEMSTNRLYLSNYINSVYKCSFRVWIAQLRISEAKRLMSNNPRMTLATVAEKVGFTTSAAFTHAFSSVEGASPRQWLKNMEVTSE